MILEEWIIYLSNYEDFLVNKTTDWTKALKYWEAYFMD